MSVSLAAHHSWKHWPWGRDGPRWPGPEAAQTLEESQEPPRWMMAGLGRGQARGQ